MPSSSRPINRFLELPASTSTKCVWFCRCSKRSLLILRNLRAVSVRFGSDCWSGGGGQLLKRTVFIMNERGEKTNCMFHYGWPPPPLSNASYFINKKLQDDSTDICTEVRFSQWLKFLNCQKNGNPNCFGLRRLKTKHFGHPWLVVFAKKDKGFASMRRLNNFCRGNLRPIYLSTPPKWHSPLVTCSQEFRLVTFNEWKFDKWAMKVVVSLKCLCHWWDEDSVIFLDCVINWFQCKRWERTRRGFSWCHYSVFTTRNTEQRLRRWGHWHFFSSFVVYCDFCFSGGKS